MQTYARPGVERALLELQDRHGLNVNMILWCLWCAQQRRSPADIVIRNAEDLSRRWSSAVTQPVRKARQALSSPAFPAAGGDSESLRQKIKAIELDSEKMEQEMLEALSDASPDKGIESASAASAARKSLAAYVRLSGAAKTPGFSVSLLENLIKLSLPLSDSDGDGVG